jgi:cytochrome P450
VTRSGTHPEVGAAGAAHLARFLAGELWRLKRPKDACKATLHEWVRNRSARGEGADLSVGFGRWRAMLVNDPGLSAAVLAPPPREDAVTASPLRTRPVGFLAPKALTISHDADWERRRPLNERVLDTGRPHERRREYLDALHAAFAAPVRSPEGIREAMGRLMLSVVLGPGASEELPAQVRELMGVVTSAPKRLLLGRLYAGKRARLYAGIRRQWDVAPERTLVGRFRALGAPLGEDEALQQIPHWMFTFVLSGTTLLTRSLAMIGSRPETLGRVRAEIEAAGSLEDPASIDRLPFLDACIRETGRLFAPVTFTIHATPHGADLDGRHVPGGTQIVQYFPLMQRNTARDPSADDWVPERWLTPGSGARALYPNLFLSGARECPGRDLITFVCTSAIAIQVGRHGVRVEGDGLGADPLPLAFPDGGLTFSCDHMTAKGGEMTATRAGTSYAELVRMSQAELDALYRDVEVPGPAPMGDTQGTALVLPGRGVSEILRKVARLLWQGKVFDPARGTLLNKISPLAVKTIRARVYVGDSWFDRGTQATVLDYSKTSLVARWIRDEIREVGPGLWLGKVYAGRWHVLDFALQG